MTPLSHTAANAYRRIDLDARIEAASGADLTRICLEEAVSALAQALLSLEQKPGIIPRDPVTRAHGITVWLARSVAPENPLRSALVQFYGGLASTIARNLVRASAEELAKARGDLADLLEAIDAG